MFTKTLLPDTFRAIKLISDIPEMKDAYLAGGTALALQLGHRISYDLDFFTYKKFDEKVLALSLSRYKEYKEDGKSWRTVWGKISKTKFSMFWYKSPLIGKTIAFEGIQLASIEDIAAMKLVAVKDRGTRRDFYDLFFIAKKYPLEKMFEFYDKKYKLLEDHVYSIIRSLSYFEDAEKDDKIPKMLIDVSWEDVKKYFEKEVIRVAHKYLGV